MLPIATVISAGENAKFWIVTSAIPVVGARIGVFSRERGGVGVATLPVAELSAEGRGVVTALHPAKIRPITTLVIKTCLLEFIASSFRRCINPFFHFHEPASCVPKLMVLRDQDVLKIAPIELMDDEIA